MDVTLGLDVPEGWTYVRKPSLQFSVEPHKTYWLDFELRTPAERTEGWKAIAIRADADGKRIGSIELRVQLNGGALPQ